jgi:hypothetical protein
MLGQESASASEGMERNRGDRVEQRRGTWRCGEMEGTSHGGERHELSHCCTVAWRLRREGEGERFSAASSLAAYPKANRFLPSSVRPREHLRSPAWSAVTKPGTRSGTEP